MSLPTVSGAAQSRRMTTAGDDAERSDEEERRE